MIKKQEHERKIFQHFGENISYLEIDVSTIESRPEPEPDILCKDAHGNFIAFELLEIIDQNMMKFIGTKPSRRPDVFVEMVHAPLSEKIEQKFHKHYETRHPIHLLAYQEGLPLIFDHPNDIRPIEEWINSQISHSPFKAVWIYYVDERRLLNTQNPLTGLDFDL